MTLLAQITVTLAMIILLVLVEPFLTFIVSIVLGLAYASIYSAVSGLLKRLGEARFKANQDRFVAVSEAFGAAKGKSKRVRGSLCPTLCKTC